jgi:hypothetical protein
MKTGDKVVLHGVVGDVMPGERVYVYPVKANSKSGNSAVLIHESLLEVETPAPVEPSAIPPYSPKAQKKAEALQVAPPPYVKGAASKPDALFPIDPPYVQKKPDEWFEAGSKFGE